ncbi:hypothetical protein [Methylobacterium planeticum]|uniref:DUF4328 domain-containing protein n=1 Tax=Methylobacterium planeticum TaxID=2615211 RepID=A0A6N6MCY9_9HYPH|nr:hypothetical protein [Methylobacterium planeticum]KAB1068491.1 hypothetical protein F6X51_26905 [Methylobacterium planeticum]
MFPVYRVVTRKRGVVGNLCKWSFIALNGLNLWWLWAYLEAAFTSAGRGMSALAGTGVSLGSGSGAVVAAFFWLIGEAGLGVLTFLTRSRMVVLIDTRRTGQPVAALDQGGAA